MPDEPGHIADPFKLPEFPTQFTEKDALRKKELDTQLKSLSEVYSQRFSEEQWRNLPALERGARNIIAGTPFLDMAARLLTPEEFGFDLGGHDSAQARLMEMQSELLDLSRRKLVIDLLPNIKTDLRIAKLAHEPIESMSDLLDKFPELNANFNKEEIAYIADLANRVAQSSLPDVASGKVFYDFAIDQQAKVLEGLEAYFENQQIQPSLILSTVAFTQDQALINKALLLAFPPTNVDEQKKAALSESEAELDERRGTLKGEPSGVIRDPDHVPTPVFEIGRAHAKIAEETGELTILADLSSGTLVPANIFSDFSVKVDGEVVGFVNPGDPTRTVLPVTNQEYIPEEKGKDLWDAFRFAVGGAGEQLRDFFTIALPQAGNILGSFQEAMNMTTEQILAGEADKSLQRSNEFLADMKVIYEANKADWQEFQRQNPELMPRPEWTQGWQEGLRQDPWGYLAYQVLSTAPSIITGLTVGTITSTITGSPTTGAAAGAIALTPMVSQGLYDDLIASGASQQDATILTSVVGPLLGAIEMVGDIPFLKAASPLFMRVLRKKIAEELVEWSVRRAVVGGVSTFVKIEAGQVTEEVLQDVLQNVTVSLINEDREILGDLDETIVNAALATVPLALFGAGAGVVNDRMAGTAGPANPFIAGQSEWAEWQAPGQPMGQGGRNIDLKDMANFFANVLFNEQANVDSVDADVAFRGLNVIIMNFQLFRWLKSNQYLELNQEIQDQLMNSVMNKPSVKKKFADLLDKYRESIASGNVNINDSILEIFILAEELINQEAQVSLNELLIPRHTREKVTGQGGLEFTEENVGKGWDAGVYKKFEILERAELPEKLLDKDWEGLNRAQKAKIMKTIMPAPIEESAEQTLARDNRITENPPVHPKEAVVYNAGIQEQVDRLNLEINNLSNSITKQHANIEKSGQLGSEEQLELIAEMKVQLEGLERSRDMFKSHKVVPAPTQPDKLSDVVDKKALEETLHQENIRIAESFGGTVEQLSARRFKGTKSDGTTAIFKNSDAALEFVQGEEEFIEPGSAVGPEVVPEIPPALGVPITESPVGRAISDLLDKYKGTSEVGEFVVLNKAEETRLRGDAAITYDKGLDALRDEARSVTELRRQAELRRNKAESPRLLSEAQNKADELEKKGVVIIEHTGEPYVSGAPLKVVNNFAKAGEEQFIVETLSPTIRVQRPDGSFQILESGTVSLGTKEQAEANLAAGVNLLETEAERYGRIEGQFGFNLREVSERQDPTVKPDTNTINGVDIHWTGNMKRRTGSDADIWLDTIRTEPSDRGQGKASKALKVFTDIADKVGASIFLEVKPLRGSSMDTEQLTAWYERHGFVQTGGTSMERQPAAQPVTEAAVAQPPSPLAKQLSGMVIYHGTETPGLKFGDLSLSRAGSNLGFANDDIQGGIYFSARQDIAKFYGSNRGKRVYIVKAGVKPTANVIYFSEVNRRTAEQLIADGVDVVVRPGQDGQFDEVVILNESALTKAPKATKAVAQPVTTQPVTPEVRVERRLSPETSLTPSVTIPDALVPVPFGEREILGKDIEVRGALYRTREQTGLGTDFRDGIHFETKATKALVFAEETQSKIVDRYFIKPDAIIYDENVSGRLQQLTSKDVREQSGGADIIVRAFPSTEIIVTNLDAVVSPDLTPTQFPPVTAQTVTPAPATQPEAGMALYIVTFKNGWSLKVNADAKDKNTAVTPAIKEARRRGWPTTNIERIEAQPVTPADAPKVKKATGAEVTPTAEFTLVQDTERLFRYDVMDGDTRIGEILLETETPINPTSLTVNEFNIDGLEEQTTVTRGLLNNVLAALENEAIKQDKTTIDIIPRDRNIEGFERAGFERIRDEGHPVTGFMRKQVGEPLLVEPETEVTPTTEQVQAVPETTPSEWHLATPIIDGGTHEQQTQIQEWLGALPLKTKVELWGVHVVSPEEVGTGEFTIFSEKDVGASYDIDNQKINIRDSQVTQQNLYHEVGHAVIEGNITAGMTIIEDFSKTAEIREGQTVYQDLPDMNSEVEEIRANNPDMTDTDITSFLYNNNRPYHVWLEEFAEGFADHFAGIETRHEDFMGRIFSLTPDETPIETPGTGFVLVPDEQVSGTTDLAIREISDLETIWEEASVNEKMFALREDGRSDESAFKDFDELDPSELDFVEGFGEWLEVNRDKLLGVGSIYPDYLQVPFQMDWERYYNEGMIVAGNNPIFQKVVKPLKRQIKRAEEGRAFWSLLDEKGKLALAKELGLPKSSAGKGFDDMTPIEQGLVSMGAQPNDSLSIPWIHDLVDTYPYFQLLQEKTNLPFTPVAWSVGRAVSEVNILRKLALKSLDLNPAVKTVMKDEQSISNVGKIINSKAYGSTIERPDSTPEEDITVGLIEEIFRSMEPWVRYHRVDITESTLEAFKEEFPDAVEAGKTNELEIALSIKLSGNKDALRTYLTDKTWGVLETGYDPRMSYSRSFRSGRGRIGKTFGKGRFERRNQVDISEEELTDIFVGLASYMKSVYTQVFVEPLLRSVEQMWFPISEKFSDRDMITGGLTSWSSRIQGIPVSRSKTDQVINQFIIQGVKSIFAQPALALRNMGQSVIQSVDKTDLLLAAIPLSAEETEYMKLTFDSYVSNFGGLQKAWLGMDKGEKELPIFKPLNSIIEWLAWYDWSDYLPRLHQFKASYIKAGRALKEYLESPRNEKDLKKFIKNSGLISLRKTEQNFLLSQFLSNPELVFPNELPGLESTGAQMIQTEIAKRITDRVSGEYNRHQRGMLEMSKGGMNIWSLVVYPRMVGQNYFFEMEHIANWIKGDEDFTSSRIAFKHLLTLLMSAEVAGAVYALLSGKERNPWNPLGILFGYEFGGLVLGIGQDLFEVINTAVSSTILNTDEKLRKVALDSLGVVVTKFAQMEIPYLIALSHALDSLLGSDNVMTQGLQALLDTKTELELEEMDRNLMERWRNGILGWDATKTDFDKMKARVFEARVNLGVPDARGTKTTTKQFGAMMEAEFKEIPDALLTPEDGWSDLTMFYLESRANWKEYYELPNDAGIRRDWRKSHLKADAMMIFWGKVNYLVYSKGSPEAEQYDALFTHWMDLYDLSWSQLPKADWRYPNIVPSENATVF